MAERNYEARAFEIRDTRTVAQTQVQGADTRVRTPIETGDDQWRARLVEGLGRTAGQALEKMADIEYSNLQLEGQAAVGTVKSEEELQGNPLTRDWKVAGYRDTMGKLALADMEASFNVDVQTLREKEPEEMQAYLNERRQKFLPGWSGMSREARAMTAGQMLLQDRAALQKYTGEHTKFIIEQKTAAVQSLWSTKLRSMFSAQSQTAIGELSPDAYKTQLESTAGTLVGAIWEDQSLPRSVKQQLTFEALQQTLAQDSVDLHEYVQNNPMLDSRGEPSTLLSRLTGEQQLGLANSYRDAYRRTSDKRTLLRAEQNANLIAQIDAQAYSGTMDDLKATLDPQVINGDLSGDARQGILNKYLDWKYKDQESGSGASAFLRGDTHGLFLQGKSEQDGLNDMDAMMVRAKYTPEQRLNTYLSAGQNGQTLAFKAVGTVLGTSLRQIKAPDGTVLPQHLKTFTTINTALQNAEDNGYTNARATLLSGLPETDRLFAERVFGLVNNKDANDASGATVDEAVQRASDMEAKEAQLSPAVKAAQAAQSATAVTSEVMALEPRNAMETVWAYTKSVFSEEAATDIALRPKSDTFGSRGRLFGDSPTAEFYTQRVREAVANEANSVLMNSPSASPEQVIRVAKANVASRTIQSRHGPVVMPRGSNLETTFGVAQGNQAAIGPALDGILKETKDGAEWQVTFAPNGKLFAQEFDDKGARIGNGAYIDPKSIKDRIKQDTDKRRVVADAQFGAGTQVSGDGVIVRYNGDNTAGVPNGWMHSYRSNLVEHEGIRSTPYDDLSGNKDKSGKVIQTVGVGVSSHNPFYPRPDKDGKVSGKAINESFGGASNSAAEAGARIAKNVGRFNEPGFKLMAELAYQSGNGFLDQQNKTGERYRQFADAYAGKDVQAAQDAFKGTAAWYYSRDPKNPDKVTKRQQSYLTLIDQAMKGK